MLAKISQIFRYHKWVKDDSNHELLSNVIVPVVCKVCEEKGKFLTIFGAGCETNRGCKGKAPEAGSPAEALVGA